MNLKRMDKATRAKLVIGALIFAAAFWAVVLWLLLGHVEGSTVPFTQAPLKAQIVAVIGVLIVIGLGVQIVRAFWKGIVEDDSWLK